MLRMQSDQQDLGIGFHVQFDCADAGDATSCIFRSNILPISAQARCGLGTCIWDAGRLALLLIPCPPASLKPRQAPSTADGDQTREVLMTKTRLSRSVATINTITSGITTTIITTATTTIIITTTTTPWEPSRIRHSRMPWSFLRYLGIFFHWPSRALKIL